MANHINYPNDKSQIYCRFDNKIITLDEGGKFWDKCTQCPLFAGDYQGNGVECSWEDDGEHPYSDNPTTELMRVSRLIDEGTLKKYNK